MVIQLASLPAHFLFNHLVAKAMGGFSLISNAWATNITYSFTALLLMVNIWMSNDLVIRRIWPYGYKFFHQVFGK